MSADLESLELSSNDDLSKAISKFESMMRREKEEVKVNSSDDMAEWQTECPIPKLVIKKPNPDDESPAVSPTPDSLMNQVLTSLAESPNGLDLKSPTSPDTEPSSPDMGLSQIEVKYEIEYISDADLETTNKLILD